MADRVTVVVVVGDTIVGIVIIVQVVVVGDGGVSLGYPVVLETSATRPGSHHTESEPPCALCVTVSCVN